MMDVWGDRSTLERTIQHVLRSMTQWGLLQAGSEHGSLVGVDHKFRVSGVVSQILAHSILLGQGKGMTYSNLREHPAFFPFKLDVHLADLIASSTFIVHRQGDQSDLIEIR
jgi:hypothetical protein